MNRDIKIDDRHIIEEVLRRKKSGTDQAPIPEDRVRKFLNRIGEEIARDGTISQEVMEQLAAQVKDGTI